MYTTLFLAQALLQGLLLAWLVRIRRRTGAAAAAVLMLPQLGLVYDNLMVALGSFIGLGPLLEALSWPRFWTHWFCGSWLIIACGSILRLAGFDWARRRWVMGAFCLLTAALMLHDLPEFWSNRLYPVCQFDLVRYSTSVAADKFCLPDQLVVKGEPPFAAIVTSFVVIGTGIVLLARRGFPWMLAGAVLMLLSATPPAMPYKLDNLGEVLIAGGCIWAIARFARDRTRAAGAK
ncbi:MAG: hypothetical protein U1F11_12705 [Steroidobacteraceae bacterium]